MLERKRFRKFCVFRRAGLVKLLLGSWKNAVNVEEGPE